MCKRSRQSWHRQLLSASLRSHIRWRAPCQNEVGFKTKPYLSLHLYFRFCPTTLFDLCCAEVALDSCSVRLGLPLTNGMQTEGQSWIRRAIKFTKRSTSDTLAGYVSVASRDGNTSPPLRVRMLPHFYQDFWTSFRFWKLLYMTRLPKPAAPE